MVHKITIMIFSSLQVSGLQKNKLHFYKIGMIQKKKNAASMDQIIQATKLTIVLFYRFSMMENYPHLLHIEQSGITKLNLTKMDQ